MQFEIQMVQLNLQYVQLLYHLMHPLHHGQNYASKVILNNKKKKMSLLEISYKNI